MAKSNLTLDEALKDANKDLVGSAEGTAKVDTVEAHAARKYNELEAKRKAPRGASLLT